MSLMFLRQIQTAPSMCECLKYVPCHLYFKQVLYEAVAVLEPLTEAQGPVARTSVAIPPVEAFTAATMKERPRCRKNHMNSCPVWSWQPLIQWALSLAQVSVTL